MYIWYVYVCIQLHKPHVPTTRSRTGENKQKRKRNQKCEEVKKISKRSSRLLSLKTTIPININYHMPNRLRHAKQIGIVFDPHLHDAA